ncbi:NAD(P)-dependent oxidoreductase [Paracoccus tegillarcae]|uniref:NAD(P)-dependent oxidoreductase n=1 Tax=Paracoccus tegillarcae TaxID=1529068 RepID=A0A2K9EPB6_9RHOB|nr:NAD(P)-dependent oxidoreductase [Paracoccus tegillarcae]AUH35327.1 NAD(P)-dependent oxidoreductase [Paracoccus tegillarcae]
MAEKARIGFIGVGYMGHGMARNLIKQGHPMQVIGNRNRQPVEDLLGQGATEAASPKQMASEVDIIHLCLPNSVSVEGVMRGPDGILAGAHEGLIVIDATTADPNSTIALAEELSAKGAKMVDAPLGRTPKEAEEGTLDAMVGCDEETFQQVLPVIDCWAGNINHIGPVGSAHKMKLIMNFISMGYAALFAEALVTAGAAGISPQTVQKVIGSSRMSNGFFDTFMSAAVGRDREAHKFTITNAAKDLRYCAAMAMQSGIANPMGAAMRNSFATAEATGHGGDYVPQLADIMAQLNGLDMEELVTAGKG